MKKIRDFSLLLTFAGLFLAAAPAFAQGSSSCDKTLVRQRVNQLNLASIRLEIPKINEYYVKLYGACSGSGTAMQKEQQFLAKLKAACDQTCYQKLGEYYLLTGRTLRLLSADPGASVLGGDPLVGLRLGIRVLDQGIQQLMNEVNRPVQMDAAGEKITSFEDQEPIADAGVNRLDAFQSKNARLKGLRARLKMALGDIYYQKDKDPLLSYLRIKASTTNEQVGFMESARAEYSRALADSLDALIDVPITGQPILRDEIKGIKKDVQLRLESLKAGHSFVGINPLKVSDRNLAELEGEIRSRVTTIKAYEDKLTGILTYWNSKNLNNAAIEVQDKRWARERDLSTRAQRLSNLSTKIAGYDRQKATLADLLGKARDKKISSDEMIALQYSLKSLENEFGQKSSEIQRQKDWSSSNEALARIGDERDQIRFAMNQLQINTSMQNELTSLGSQIDAQNTEIKRLKLEIDATVGKKNAEASRIKEFEFEDKGLDSEIKQLAAEKKNRNEHYKAFLTSQVKSYETDLTYLLGQTAKQGELCALQKAAKTATVDELSAQIQLAKDPSQPMGQWAFLREQYNQEKALAATQLGNYKDDINRARSYIASYKELAQDGSSITNTMAALDGAVEIYKAICTLPTLLTTPQGPGKVDDSAKTCGLANLQSAIAAAQAAGSAALYNINVQQALNAMNQKLDTMERDLNVKEAEKNLADQTFHAKVAGLLNLQADKVQQLRLASDELKIVKFQCDANFLQLNADQARSDINKALEERRYTLDNLPFLDEINDEKARSLSYKKSQVAEKIRQSRIADSNIDIALQQLSEGKALAERTMVALQSKQTRVTQLNQDMQVYLDDNNRIDQALQRMREERLALIKKDSDAQFADLGEVIKNSKSKLTSLLQNAQSFGQDYATLVQRIEGYNSNLAQLTKTVEDESNQLVNHFASVDDGIQEGVTLRYADILDADLAMFSPSLSDLAEQKMRALLQVNQQLRLYALKASLASNDYSLTDSLNFLLRSQEVEYNLDTMKEAVRKLPLTAVQLAWFELPANSKIVMDLNRFGRSEFMLSDSLSEASALVLNKADFQRFSNKKIVDIALAYKSIVQSNDSSTACQTNDRREPIVVTNLGFNQFDAQIDGIPFRQMVYLDEETMLSDIINSDESPAHPNGEMGKLDEFYRGRVSSGRNSLGDFLGLNSPDLRLKWISRSLQSHWRLSLPRDRKTGEFRPICKVEGTTPTFGHFGHMYLWVWYIGDPNTGSNSPDIF